MGSFKLHIKNTVCQRCISTVEKILKDHGISYQHVELGYAHLNEIPSEAELAALQQSFKKVGFEIIESRNMQLINKVKSVIIQHIYKDDMHKKLSEILSENIPYDYSHLSQLFSEDQQQTIQQYYNTVKMERAKELLDYDEDSIAMVADKLGFSTAAYFSTAFKNYTGYTPSEYKNLPKKNRNKLDSI